MKVQRSLFACAFLALIITVLIGCGGGTPTPVPPTAVPPTNTPAPISKQPLQDAFDLSKKATAYRVKLSMSGKGNFSSAGLPTPQPGQENEPLTLVNMQGEVSGNDAHYSIQGILTAFLGIDPAKTFEVITADGKAFLKGPVPLLGANEEKWYQAPAQAASIAQPPLTPGSFLSSFGESGINPADFKESGTESIDGKSCTVYSGDKAAVLNAFSKLGGATGATQEDLDSIDNAEFKFWVCDDGYLHQVRMLIEGHEKDKPESTGSFEIMMNISDFNSAINIDPPADAIELQLPQTEPEASPTP